MQKEASSGLSIPSPTGPPSRFPTGTRVELRGLRGKPELNGRRGVVIRFVASSGRYAVRVDGGVVDFKLKPGNIHELARPVVVLPGDRGPRGLGVSD